LDDVAFAVTRRPYAYAIHILNNFKADVTSKSIDDRVLRYTLRCAEYSAHNIETTLAAIQNTRDLSNFLKSTPSLDFKFWIFVDEAQRVYENEPLWRTLTAMHPQKLFVVAAGSYGSHTGSAAHSPPHQIISKSWRISLFPSGEDDTLCVAFTKSDFDKFIELALKTTGCDSLDVNLQERILNYASPYRPGNNAFQGLLHPGVAVELTMYLLNKVCCPSV